MNLKEISISNEKFSERRSGDRHASRMELPKVLEEDDLMR